MNPSSAALRLTGCALGAVAVVGVLRAPGDHSSTTPAIRPAATTWSASSYTSWTGTGWEQGTRTGTTRGSGDGLAFSRSQGRVSIGGAAYERAWWTSPWTTPAHSFDQVIPSWQATTPSGAAVRFYLRARTAGGTVSSWDSLGLWTTRDGELKRSSAGSQTDDLAQVATDTFRARTGSFRSWQIRAIVYRKPGTPGPTITSLGAVATKVSTRLPATSRPLSSTGRTLAVPAYSQMIHRGEYPQYGGGGEAWCSPTSTAMVMAYYGSLPPAANYAWVKSGYPDRWVDHVARMTFDYGYDGTGNWPFNTAFATQYVDHGFVTRLRNLRDAEQFIRAGIPVVASITFARGQLSGAPISATNGHLVVIRGFTDAGNVVVNDPAASSNAGVKRTYDRAQFEAAWLRKSSGMAYILRDDAHPLPVRDGATAW